MGHISTEAYWNGINEIERDKLIKRFYAMNDDEKSTFTNPILLLFLL